MNCYSLWCLLCKQCSSLTPELLLHLQSISYIAVSAHGTDSLMLHFCNFYPCSCDNPCTRGLHWLWVAVSQWWMYRSQSQVWQEIRLQRWNGWIWLWWVLEKLRYPSCSVVLTVGFSVVSSLQFTVAVVWLWLCLVFVLARWMFCPAVFTVYVALKFVILFFAVVCTCTVLFLWLFICLCCTVSATQQTLSSFYIAVSATQ